MGVKDAITGRLLGSANPLFSDEQITNTLQLLMTHGLEQNASAIHIEPQDQCVLVRYRIDGALRGVHKLPRDSAELIVQHLKTISGLDSNETHSPQEGDYGTDVNGQNLRVRLSFMPVVGGEKVVLHLHPERKSPLNLEALGFWGDGLNDIHEALARTSGLILVAGPKHSGKTTTLYGMLGLVNSPIHSIATVEVQKTYHLPGASQSYVHPKSGATMLDGLKAVLSQDPNIIMLGSLPNHDTSELAVQSSARGHLILAEMPNDDAATSILHLRAMGADPFLLTTALRIAVGQRLVRKLCTECREQYTLDDARRDKLEKIFGIESDAARTRITQLEQEAIEYGLGDGTPNFMAMNGLPRLWRPTRGGCEHCNHTGFKGRVALVEVLANNESIQKQLLGPGNVTATELHKAAIKSDFIPMGLDGLIKALCGLTTVTEVLRAVGRNPS